MNLNAEERVIDEAIDVVESAFGIDDLTVRSRHPRWDEGRRIAMWMAKHVTDASLPRLGEKFDRDHSTVLVNIRRVEEKRDNDDQFAQVVNRLRAELGRRLKRDGVL